MLIILWIISITTSIAFSVYYDTILVLISINQYYHGYNQFLAYFNLFSSQFWH
jgi:hypothetical protein